MYQDQVVLCGASAYEQKYYLNEDFKSLPSQVQDELKIMCVLFTEDVGGILTLVFDEDGKLLLETSADEGESFVFLWKEILHLEVYLKILCIFLCLICCLIFYRLCMVWQICSLLVSLKVWQALLQYPLEVRLCI